MTLPIEIPVTTAGMLAAVACVVAGGPLFAAGLRALRQRRVLAGLSPVALEPDSQGFVRLQGTVALESPLFSPLSMRPCAGYLLEVRAAEAKLGGRVGQQRGFRIVSGECEAFVEAATGEWAMPVTAERLVRAGEAVSANMAALLDRDATLRWMRSRHAAMRIVERSLEAGARVEVIGYARGAGDRAGYEIEALAATGTDGPVEMLAAPPLADRPQLRVSGCDPLEVVVIGDGGADPMRFAPSHWRAVGAVLGPALSLAGLVYLAHAAEATIAGRF